MSMLEILRKTPPWVFFLFFALLYLGLRQTRDRKVTRATLLSVPAGMIGYSLYELLFSIGLNLYTAGLWLAALAAAWWIGATMYTTKRADYDPRERRFFMVGSWFPLVVIMGIFCTKYVFGAVTALRPDIAGMPTFLWIFSVINGLFSGLFAARIRFYWKASKLVYSPVM